MYQECTPFKWTRDRQCPAGEWKAAVAGNSVEYTSDHSLWKSEFNEAVGPDKILNGSSSTEKSKLVRDN